MSNFGFRRVFQRPLRVLQQQAYAPSTATATRLDASQLLEEEKTPYYSPKNFYPAIIGQVLNDRYQLATKLGYGSGSTVWLARDVYQWRWMTERYVAVKISSTSRPSRTQSAEDERSILRHITKTNPRHLGWYRVRRLLDSFNVGNASEHICLVFEPLREPLWLHCRRYIGHVIPSEILKIMVRMILEGLDYLHAECRVVHTDLKPDNIMVQVEDASILHEDACDEFADPLPQKHCEDGRIIYMSRNNYGPPRRVTGLVRITDFDLSVRGDGPHHGPIQAEVYRAPEVILDAGYTYSADIWSLGVMLWDLLEGEQLFQAVNPRETGEYDEARHLAYITALLGAPPPELLETGRRTSMFYSSQGKLESSIPEGFSFESSLSKIGGEEKKMFIQFVRRLIKWRPEERSTAKELLEDPWLHVDFPQD